MGTKIEGCGPGKPEFIYDQVVNTVVIDRPGAADIDATNGDGHEYAILLAYRLRKLINDTDAAFSFNTDNFRACSNNPLLNIGPGFSVLHKNLTVPPHEVIVVYEPLVFFCDQGSADSKNKAYQLTYTDDSVEGFASNGNHLGPQPPFKKTIEAIP